MVESPVWLLGQKLKLYALYVGEWNTLGMFRKPFSPYSNTYNPSWRNHPNFNWKSNKNKPTSFNNLNTKAPPPRNYPTPQYNARPNMNPLEEILQAFMEAQGQTNKKFDSILIQVVEENKEIKSQITKHTSAFIVKEWGKFPSQPQSIPKGQHMTQTLNSNSQNIKKVNAIVT